MNETKQVDSYRFLDGMVKRMVKSWIRLETQQEIPWTPLTKPLKECNVALVSSAGLALKTDRPFDQEGERRNPWWGDPSYRVIPSTAQPGDLALYHLHINPGLVAEDMNTLFPLGRLLELEQDGEIGRAAASHYAYMGYLLQPQELLETSLPEMIACMQADEVDVVVLVPG